ncbi:Ppx/GppA phosphatase family protein [Inediibacterium massiliense]|uniref:Ppx/GppA phosphatase family protein n=1 Tax=Inediibacterium massiliense TaxID=1658111 RepID=UPI0006B4BF5E|nr:Ppx/GppA phosphatase family protein [Inediibacterium massiliense]
MKKLGAIDIGTNSMRILIAKVKNNQIIESFKDLRSTRIGEGVDKTGVLSNHAIQRNIDALKEFVEIAHKEKVEKLSIIATSAVRDAKNKGEFLRRASKEAGVQIEVISGEREATLGFLGVLKGIEQKKNILVVDIGGGSTEFILGNEKGIDHVISMNMGAVRMTEKFVHTDPVSKEEIDQMSKDIDKQIEIAMDSIKDLSIDCVVGIGGTITTLAAVHKKLKVYDRNEVHNTKLRHDQIQKILDEFLSKNMEERIKMEGVHPKRADIITAGTLILDRILSWVHKDIIVSEYDNLEGLIFDELH